MTLAIKKKRNWAIVLRKIPDLFFMSKDFLLIVLGKDYFHLPEKLGDYFSNGKSYYNEMKGKAHWKGPLSEEVPTLYVPSLKKRIFFPSMILQWGIGSLDTYFITGDKVWLSQVKATCHWLFRHVKPDNSFDNNFSLLDTEYGYYSNNSGMTQGLAISFLSRVLKHLDVNSLGFQTQQVEDLIHGIYENMIEPVESGGGALYKNDNLYFCEYCRKDGYIVLNGWIFSLFGLWDYIQMFPDPQGSVLLEKTLGTLEGEIPKYLCTPSHWSYYDNQGRLCSTIYQSLHIHLFDALFRLTGKKTYDDFMKTLKSSYNFRNRIIFTLIKIRDKVFDTYRYGTT